MGWVAALIGAALTLSGCGRGAQGEATEAVQTFLAAVHANDRPAFEAMIDRPALRADLRDQLMALSRSKGLEVDGGASEFALDRMITPRAIELVDAASGQPLAAAPDARQIKGMVRLLERDLACVSASGAEAAAPCVLSFARRDDQWRLVSMQAGQSILAVDPPAAR